MDGAGIIILSEVKQAQKDKHHFIPLSPHSNMNVPLGILTETLYYYVAMGWDQQERKDETH